MVFFLGWQSDKADNLPLLHIGTGPPKEILHGATRLL
jgi:hypothetical protein